MSAGLGCSKWRASGTRVLATEGRWITGNAHTLMALWAPRDRPHHYEERQRWPEVGGPEVGGLEVGGPEVGGPEVVRPPLHLHLRLHLRLERAQRPRWKSSSRTTGRSGQREIIDLEETPSPHDARGFSIFTSGCCLFPWPQPHSSPCGHLTVWEAGGLEHRACQASLWLNAFNSTRK
jgi:hypothetical protein